MAHNNRIIRRGFTLIEILVVVGVLSVISIVIAQAFFATTKSNTKAEITKEAKQSGSYAMTVMERTIRNARNVDGDCDGVPRQSIAVSDREGTVTSFSCLYDSSAQTTKIVQDTGGSAVPLTGDSLSIGESCSPSSLVFTCIPRGGQAPSVRISFRIFQKSQSPDPAEQASAEFDTTVNLRTLSEEY